MKTLQEIQDFNRRKIICAVHNTEDYEEALKKERGDFCHYIYNVGGFWGRKEIEICGDIKGYGYNGEKNHPNAFLKQIIGKPLTLSRVLLAIRERGYFDDIYFGDETATLEFDIKDLSWDLTEETLEEQSEHTRRAIFGLLGGKDD
jgi:hypothetical protein